MKIWVNAGGKNAFRFAINSLCVEFGNARKASLTILEYSITNSTWLLLISVLFGNHH